jgi:hypothetical protein
MTADNATNSVVRLPCRLQLCQRAAGAAGSKRQPPPRRMRLVSVVAGRLVIAEDECMPISFSRGASSQALVALPGSTLGARPRNQPSPQIADAVGGSEVLRGKQTDVVRPLTTALWSGRAHLVKENFHTLGGSKGMGPHLDGETHKCNGYPGDEAKQQRSGSCANKGAPMSLQADCRKCHH